MPIGARAAEYAIDHLFLNRWSPRAFTGEAIAATALFSLFEAARWAPSANNAQPWRFIYATRDTDYWPVFLGFLSETNRRWAVSAAALVILISKTDHVRPGASEGTHFRSHSFDAGSAWSSLAFQAFLTGWRTRAMGGFDHDKARATLKVPDNYRLEIAIAIGRQADASTLPSNLQEKEFPTQRRPLQELVAEGRFTFDGADARQKYGQE